MHRNRRLPHALALLGLAWATSSNASPVHRDLLRTDPDSLRIEHVVVAYDAGLDLLVFRIEVAGALSDLKLSPHGGLDGAPVLGFVFPTTLSPEDVGFSATEGIVALAGTLHPDFDDTPLWDENGDRDYANDGALFHPHWVVLTEDARVPGSLAVKSFAKGDPTVILPPTNPGMPMYMDSPGFSVVIRDRAISILVPASRVHHRTDFAYDGVAAFMQVNTSDENRPMLGVYEVLSVEGGALALEHTVDQGRTN